VLDDFSIYFEITIRVYVLYSNNVNYCNHIILIGTSWLLIWKTNILLRGGPGSPGPPPQNPALGGTVCGRNFIEWLCTSEANKGFTRLLNFRVLNRYNHNTLFSRVLIYLDIEFGGINIGVTYVKYKYNAIIHCGNRKFVHNKYRNLFLRRGVFMCFNFNVKQKIVLIFFF